jgi:hypothetical protein
VKREIKVSLKSFLIELFVYALLVVGYFYLVLNLLGDWLHHLYEIDRKLYAVIALILVIGQGLLLEGVTRLLLAWIKPQVEP